MRVCKKTLAFAFLTLLILTAIACGKKKSPLFEPSQAKPGSAEYLCNEGLAFLDSGDFTQARNRFQAALAKAPSNIDAILGMGLVHLNNRELDQSLSYFERLKELTPDSYDVYNYMGIIYLELQQYPRARENLLIAATSSTYKTPENAYANLAILEIKQNNLDAAMRYIKKGLEKKKNFPQLHILEGQVLEAQKNWQDALLAYERASTITYNNDPGILIALARLHKQLGDKDKALNILESSLGKARNEAERQTIINMIADINSQN